MYVNKNKTKEDKHLAGVCKEYTFMHVHKHKQNLWKYSYSAISGYNQVVFLSI